jgi:hypothetical protein
VNPVALARHPVPTWDSTSAFEELLFEVSVRVPMISAQFAICWVPSKNYRGGEIYRADGAGFAGSADRHAGARIRCPDIARSDNLQALRRSTNARRRSIRVEALPGVAETRLRSD